MCIRDRSNTYEKDMLTKLSALFNVNSDNWFEVDFSRWGSKEQDNTTFELLKNAVISHKAVCIMYVNSWGNKSKRKIYPIKMMYRAKEWYIKAYCIDRADFRIFKFNRIIEMQILSEEFTPMEYPKSADEPKQKYNTISLCFPKEMAYRVYDEFEASDIKEMENGDLIVTTEMPEDNWLIGYLLSFGTQVTVCLLYTS